MMVNIKIFKSIMNFPPYSQLPCYSSSNRRNLSFETVQRMNSYFARHEVDKEAEGWNQGEDGFASAGRIAWKLGIS